MKIIYDFYCSQAPGPGCAETTTYHLVLEWTPLSSNRIRSTVQGIWGIWWGLACSYISIQQFLGPTVDTTQLYV